MSKFSELTKQVAEELKFWQGFVKTERFLEGWCADIRTPELQEEVYNILIRQPHAKVLDVGSGVCSILYGTVPMDRLVAADPLSPLYELIFPYHKYAFPAPMPFEAEDLPYKELFDFVHISNALDHCQKPLVALESLFQAVKVGGFLIVCGFENEADAQHKQGMHQTNLSLSESHVGAPCQLLLNGQSTPLSAGYVLASKTLSNDRTWFAWIKKKV